MLSLGGDDISVGIEVNVKIGERHGGMHAAIAEIGHGSQWRLMP
jgi:hypothetical protein